MWCDCGFLDGAEDRMGRLPFVDTGKHHLPSNRYSASERY